MIDKKTKNLLDILSTREPKSYGKDPHYIKVEGEYNNYLIGYILYPYTGPKFLEFFINSINSINIFGTKITLDEDESAEYLTLANKLGIQFTNKLFSNLLKSETTIDELWDNEGDRVDNLVKSQ